MNNKEKINELKKILYSKIDQLSDLIWENINSLHFDIFEINSSNLEDKLSYIKEMVKNNPEKKCKALILKEDMIDLTKDFIQKNILDEVQKEKKKLKKVRYIYMFLILFIFIFFSTIVSLYFLWFLKFSKGEDIVCKPTVIEKNNFNTWNTNNLINKNLIWHSTVKKLTPLSWEKANIWTWNNNLSWSKITITWSIEKIEKTWNFLLGKLQNWYNLSWDILSWTLKMLDILNNKKLDLTTFQTWYILTWDTTLLLDIKKQKIQLTWTKMYKWSFILSWSLEKWVIYWSILTWYLYKTPVKVYKTWNFLLGKLQNWYKLSWDILSWTLKMLDILNNKKLDLTTFQTWYTLTWDAILLLDIKKQKIQLTWTKMYKWSFILSWSLEKWVIYWSVLTWYLYKKPVLDENLKKLSGKEIEKYKKEKKINCPYTWTIKVKVRALNLRESNTKYSKRLWLLYYGNKLDILTCSKNLKANSWWYKVRVKKTWRIWWVSTIWVWK